MASLFGLVVVGDGAALPIFGLTDNNSLVVFDSETPGTIDLTTAILGLGAGQSLVGIDFRPADGQLYGLSTDSRLYAINTTSGFASAIGSAGAFTLSGSSFGFDFNPTVDRIRVTSDAEQNLRLNPNNGLLAATDTNLAYAGTDVHAGANPGIVGSAYTNSRTGATTTTLFGIDSVLDTLVVQAPPNAGTLNTVGDLGVDTTDQVGFDILAVGNQAFASLTDNTDRSSLFRINLATGGATGLGLIGNGLSIIDIAALPIPEPGTISLFAAALLGTAAARRRRVSPTPAVTG